MPGTTSPDFLLYVLAGWADAGPLRPAALGPDYALTVDPPSPRTGLLPGVGRGTALWYAALARQGWFRNADLRVARVYHGRRTVHRAVAHPGSFRFPFMAAPDLQIGGLWTDEAHRRRRLAFIAIEALIDALARPDRRFWYVVASTNLPSIRLAEALGFQAVGRAVRTAPLGCRMLGAYSPTALEVGRLPAQPAVRARDAA